MADPEHDERTCRACGEPYEYPGHNSLATRSHCESCVEIPEPMRRALQALRRRLERLTREVAQLRGKAGGG